MKDPPRRRNNLNFSPAEQPDIVRAAQKDDFYQVYTLLSHTIAQLTLARNTPGHAGTCTHMHAHAKAHIGLPHIIINTTDSLL